MATESSSRSSSPQRALIDVQQLVDDYYTHKPQTDDARQLVNFGTSGHRGTSSNGTFTESHIAAITQAICDYREQAGTSGPMFVGKDTHALSSPAQNTALEVLAANEVDTLIQQGDRFTPTPVISRAILAHNRNRADQLADGIVITPSHNPPPDGGFKYNPPHGGPADSDATGWIQDRANQLLQSGGAGIHRRSLESSEAHAHIRPVDLVTPYVEDLAHVIDFECIRSAGIKIGVDPLGGAAVEYWEPVRSTYKIDLTIVNERVDPQFAFMPPDHDGKIRMDCSSPDAMAKLVRLKDDYDVAFANDPDADRHGIVTRSVGLMNPNHYLAVAIRYLLRERTEWAGGASENALAIGKTAVSSGIIDRVAESLGRAVVEVPVGFKWFVPGLYGGQLGFAGEESAGASFLRRDGSVWTTDKDGLILGLLAAEITARTGRDPGAHFAEIAEQFGQPYYRRIDQPATPGQKAVLKRLSPEAVSAATLAGDPILEKQTRAPGNDAPLGGLKVVTAHGWFAARPSGTENIYKIYAESFRDDSHLQQVLDEARQIVDQAFAAAP